MGAKESKAFPLTADEAARRVTDAERRRLQDAFRRLCGTSGASVVQRAAFVREVIGDGVPPVLAERIFALCGGAPASSSSAPATALTGQKGLGFRDVLTVLVLITRGTHEEKIKFIFGLLSNESNSHIERSELMRFLRELDPALGRDDIAALFKDGDKVNFDTFSRWVESHPRSLGIAEWLLVPDNNLSLVNKLDTPTFYQTLAGVTHLEEQEIVELEKRFWSLAGLSDSGQINIGLIEPLVSPPLPSLLVKSFFSAFDENHDGHIDFKELSCGVSASCRGPEMERQKFCFKIFDSDCDGVLNKQEIEVMAQCMLSVRAQTHADETTTTEELVADIVKTHDPRGAGLSLEEYLVWTIRRDNPYPGDFLRLIFQLCHIVLGLRPLTRREEGEIVRGWLEREEKMPFVVGSVWHLINMDWWSHWHAYVNVPDGATPSQTRAASSLDTASVKSRISGGKNAPSLDSVQAGGGGEAGHGITNNAGPHQLGEVVNGSSRRPSAESSRSSSRRTTPSGSPHSSRKNSGSTNSSLGSAAGQQVQVAPTRPGLIDNSSLVQPSAFKVPNLTTEGGRLKTGVRLARGKDFEILPERLWRALAMWYGGSPALQRQVIRNKEGRIELELNPLSIKLMKHQIVSRPAMSGGGHVAAVVGGYSAAAASMSLSSPYGSSSVPTTTRRYHAYQAAFSRCTTIQKIAEFLSQHLHTKQEDIRLWYFRDETTMRLLEDESLTLEDAGFKDEDSILVEIRSRDGTWPEEITSLVGTSGGDRRASGAAFCSTYSSVKGMAGLSNLGNTCYMNAALQCVANTKILAQYFNKNCHLFELNRSNPLGMKGHMAKRYGDLIRDMWADDTKAIAPIKMRYTIAKYQPHFSGFQQQDAQELLSFLLDGLHEDLNRVNDKTDKQYVELKDSDNRPDLEVAQEAWENYIMRNKSIIVDLFHGQLKSKVTCKVCGHESVRFDPFIFLSLPLPMESSIRLEVIVIRQDGSVPIKYGLTLDMEAKYSSIRGHLSRLCKIPQQNLILVEILQSQIRAVHTEEQKVKSLNGSCIFAYEFHSLLSIAASSVGGKSAQTSETNQTFADIQRNAQQSQTSSKAPTGSPSGSRDKLKSKEVSSSGGNVGGTSAAAANGNGHSSWPAQICMSGISFCFKNKDAMNGDTSSLGEPEGDSPTKGRSDKEALLANGGPKSSAAAKLSVSSASATTPSAAAAAVTATTASETKRVVHSRHNSTTNSTDGSQTSAGSNNGAINGEIADCRHGVIVAMHRKMMPQEIYFISVEKYRPVLFGNPLIVPCNESTTFRDLYRCVWTQVSRLVSPLPPKDASNHATDCDDSLRYGYPFTLKLVQKDACWCARCPWHRFCRGCAIPCGQETFDFASSYLAIDWDQTALHLRYLSAQERAFREDKSVSESLHASTEPITLRKCLEAYTREEELGEDEKYYCSRCQTHQLASKKLQIWRLPPVLIVHLKRFHFVNGRWIKSHKIVDFPVASFDPTDYLAAIPSTTLRRFKELKQKSTTSFDGATIDEVSEPNSMDGASDGDKEDDDVLGQPREGRTVSRIDPEPVPGVVAAAVRRSEAEEEPRTGRKRLESTSLYATPVRDDNLQDFHQHRLQSAQSPLDIKYNLYAMVCHSGVLAGGHYISYGRMNNSKWYCQNDSSVKEISESHMDKSTAYLLFYEREGLSLDDYLPKVSGAAPDIRDLDEELESDFKKQCCVM